MSRVIEGLAEEPGGEAIDAKYSHHPTPSDTAYSDEAAGPPGDSFRDHPALQPRKRLISPCSAFMLILVLVRLGYSILSSEHRLVSTLFTLLAFVPSGLALWFILHNFRDHSFPDSFLVSQFLVGAVPLFLITIPVELLFGLISALPVLLTLPRDAWKKYHDLNQMTNEQKAAQLYEDLMKEVAEILPAWAVVITIILISFLTAGMVEEVGKWLFARRYKGLARDLSETGRHIGSKAILGSACMVALGFATMENIGYVLGMARARADGFPVLMLGLSLFRGALAFPVHIGTQMYVAVAASHQFVFGDNTRVSVALVHAILFHGIFDGISFSNIALVTLRKIPDWTALLVPVVDIFVVGLLMLLVRARYTALLRREFVADTSEPV